MNLVYGLDKKRIAALNPKILIRLESKIALTRQKYKYSNAEKGQVFFFRRFSSLTDIY